MAKLDKKTFLEDTKNFWQPHYAQTLTAQDAKEITQTITDFFQALESWQQLTTQDLLHDAEGEKHETETQIKCSKNS